MEDPAVVVPLRLGVVGCGGSRETYGAVLRLLPGYVLSALMDPDVVAARTWVRQTRGIPQFVDFDEFLTEAEVDAVLITSPVAVRGSQALDCIAAGKHVLCDRRLARTLAECDEIAAAAKAAGVVAMCPFPKRYDPSFDRACRMVANGDLGSRLQIRCDWNFFYDWCEHRACLSEWTGVFHEMALHTVDLCRLWLGEVYTVSADVDGGAEAGQRGGMANLILNHHRGISVHHLQRTRVRNPLEQYTLKGSGGALHLSLGPVWSYQSGEPFRAILHRRGVPNENLTHVPLAHPVAEALANNPYVRILNEFEELIRQGRTDSETPRDAREALEVVHAAYLSAHERAKVSLPLVGAPDLSSLAEGMAASGR